jgi:hypothetical protein
LKDGSIAEDESKAGAADRARIDVHEDYELHYWTEKFKCTTTALQAAVAAVGVMAVEVEAHLKRGKR